jgi:hypothetical protein
VAGAKLALTSFLAVGFGAAILFAISRHIGWGLDKALFGPYRFAP